MIEAIERLVEAACAAESNVFGYGIWTHHITQVAVNGKRLAPLFNADPEIVEIAALLHDYASVKDEALYADHHIHGPREAEQILTGLGYSPARIDAVKHAIAAHRASVRVDRRSPEAVCLANADAMTHIEQVPSLLHLVFVQHGMGIDEGAAWVKAKLQRSWNKLHPDVQALVRDKYEAALETSWFGHFLQGLGECGKLSAWTKNLPWRPSAPATFPCSWPRWSGWACPR